MPTKTLRYNDLLAASLYAIIAGDEYPLHLTAIDVENTLSTSLTTSPLVCELTGTLSVDTITYGDCKKTSPIKKVIFNDPATIVFWRDGTKTVVKVQNGEKYDKMTGLAMAISKKHFGNKGNYYNEFRKWVGESK